MGSDWVIGRLGDYAESCLGKMLDKNKNRGEFYPYLGNKNVRWGSFELEILHNMRFEDHEHERYGIKYGDLIICEGGEPGRCAIWKDEIPNMKIQKALHRIRPNENLNNIYLHYWFLWKGGNGLLEPYFTGTTIKHFTGKALSNLEVSIPPITIQKAIAHILGSLDNKIELNRQMNQTLESMAQALFKSWFVDFDPVIDNALAAGHTIPECFAKRAEQRQKQQIERATNKTTESTDFKPLFPNAFEYTEEMGWIPKGWERQTLEGLVNLIGGGTPKTSIEKYWNGDIPWFSVVDAPNPSDIFVIDTEKYVTELGVKKSSTKILPIGTTIISARGTVGKCAMVARPMAMNQSCYGVTGKSNISDTFVYFNVLIRIGELQQKSHGSVFSTITRDTFKTLPVAFCGEDLTVEFHNKVKPFFDKVLENSLQAKTLKKLRDTLLPKLLSGEIRIPDAEKLIAEVE
jgi:type I restriction enzyme S subunit